MATISEITDEQIEAPIGEQRGACNWYAVDQSAAHDRDAEEPCAFCAQPRDAHAVAAQHRRIQP